MKIKKYTTNGTAVDQDWITRNRDMIENYIHDDMRANGFVPVLDLHSELFWSLNANGSFDYTINVRGVWVGKRKSSDYVGYMSEDGVLLSSETAEVMV